MEEDATYNPLAKENLGRSVVEKLLSQPEVPLGEVGNFEGAGVYAIYYRGSFTPYQPLAMVNVDDGVVPIYVGKAVPKGARKGMSSSIIARTTALSDRLREHASSIRAVNNLDLRDFSCRSLVVDDIWIPLGESLVIERFKPVWNVVLEGFGNHDPGAGRRKGMRPKWDEVHQGRAWALACQKQKETSDALLEKVSEYLRHLNK